MDGRSGTRGEDGERGKTGPPGLMGTKGARGRTGPEGEAGRIGAKGEKVRLFCLSIVYSRVLQRTPLVNDNVLFVLLLEVLGWNFKWYCKLYVAYRHIWKNNFSHYFMHT